MVTEIRRALHDAAEVAPHDDLDLAVVVTAGARRVRRRRVVAAGAAGLAVALVVGAATALSAGDDRAEKPDPAEIRIDQARTVEPDVVATRRVLWKDPANQLDYDRFDAITDDGLVARARYTYDGDISEFGLLDVETGDTDWLPRPRWDLGEPAPVDLGADRLVYLDNRKYPGFSILIFDREARAWTRSPVRFSESDVGQFFGSDLALGDDGRLYLMDPDLPVHWWSVPLTGGTIRPEPSLDKRLLAWSGSTRATSDLDGHIRVTRDGRQVAEVGGPPKGCNPPDDDLPVSPPLVFAGSRLVATFRCSDGNQVVAYNEAGEPELTLAPAANAWVRGADARYVLVTDDRKTYVLDLLRRKLLAIDNGGAAVGDNVGVVKAGLVLWAVDGPIEDRNTYDVVYRVARLK